MNDKVQVKVLLILPFVELILNYFLPIPFTTLFLPTLIAARFFLPPQHFFLLSLLAGSGWDLLKATPFTLGSFSYLFSAFAFSALTHPIPLRGLSGLPFYLLEQLRAKFSKRSEEQDQTPANLTFPFVIAIYTPLFAALFTLINVCFRKLLHLQVPLDGYSLFPFIFKNLLCLPILEGFYVLSFYSLPWYFIEKLRQRKKWQTQKNLL